MIVAAAFWWMGLLVIGAAWLLSHDGKDRSAGRA